MIYKKSIFFLSALLLFAACKPAEPQIHKLEGMALGTVWSVTIKGDMPDDMRERIESLLHDAEKSMSIFDPGSLISRLNNNRTDTLDRHIAYCIEAARGVSEMSDGKYDITILPLVEAYGFAAAEQDYRVNVDSLLDFIGYEKIAVRGDRLVKSDPRVRIDLNSVAKGYVVDLVAELIECNGIQDYLVYIGGEIFARGTNKAGEPWTIGIETPVEGNLVPGSSIERRIAVSGMGVATSGNYRRSHTDSLGRKFTHIIDPTTGRNTVSRLLSATVVAESCTRADALGTMFIALGLEQSLAMLEADPELAVLLIYSDEEGNLLTGSSQAMLPYIK